MAEYNIAEKFISINGEGTTAGQLSVFIRFKGCNLNCSYCDTKWANEPNTVAEVMTENNIYKYIKSSGIKNVTLTGGEPLIQKDIIILLEKLAADKALVVEIETNGSIDVNDVINIKANRPSLTMDYKLSSSGMENFMNTHNFELLEKKDTVKFVVGSASDLERAKQIIENYRLTKKCNVYFSPVFGSIEPTEIVEYMIQSKLNGVNLQLQMHKIIWSPDKRGV